MQYDLNSLLILTHQRIAEAERKATLRAQLGNLPKPESIRPFRRRVVALQQPVELRPTLPSFHV